ncbi:MAG TPA: hypothetical protein VK208_07810, partial [Pyrinomonadaceae bacterium]|nr:hypothetical protein [Pyrinomonadaceae bacterium]
MKTKIKRQTRKIKTIVGLLASVLLSMSSFAEAQQPKRMQRIGYLSALSRISESTRLETIRSALRELGYAEGPDISMEYRYSEGKPDRAPQLAAELVRLKVDLIVVAGG